MSEKIEYTETESIISLSGVECGYGYGKDYKMILQDINIHEKDVVIDGRITGQTIAIVGCSGRGKSTLFKTLTGLVKPRKGQVLLTDLSTPDDLTDAKIVHEGDIGYVDQKYTLFRHKTVMEIFMSAQRGDTFNEEHVPWYKFEFRKSWIFIHSFWLARRKRIEKKKKELATKYLLEWGLYEQKDQYPCELSGGQRQRTAIIEQILSAGHFMAFDEPFSGLDVGNVKACKATFALYQKENELNTIIFSTHDMMLAAKLADSIYVVGYTPDKIMADELKAIKSAIVQDFGPSKAIVHKDWIKANDELTALEEKGYIDCSTIVKHFDLKAMGLAWREFRPEHLEFLNLLTETVENS